MRRRTRQFTQMFVMQSILLAVFLALYGYQASTLWVIQPTPLRQVYVFLPCTNDIQEAVTSNDLTLYCGEKLEDAWAMGWRDDAATIQQAGWTVVERGNFVMIGSSQIFQYIPATSSASNTITLHTGPITTPGYAAGTVVAPVKGHS